MVSSLLALTPSVNSNMPLLKKSCTINGRVEWTEEMLAEYETVNQLMLTQIKLSPYNCEKALYLVIDESSRVGTGYCLLQRIQEDDPTMGFTIVSAGVSLLPTTKSEFSPIESEMISLERAVTSCDHWLRFVQQINLISDCTGLLDL